MIRGIDPAEEEKVIPIRKFIKLGKLDLEGDSTVIGVDLAQKLGLTVGDKLTVYSPGNLSEILDKLKALDQKRARRKRRQSTTCVKWCFRKNSPLPAFSRLANTCTTPSSCSCRSSSGRNSTASATRSTALGQDDQPRRRCSGETGHSKYLKPPEYAQTWIEMNRQYFDAVSLERTVMTFLLFFIVIVAAFGIMNTLITVTVQKRREIGIMKAVGASIGQIMGVFLFQGIVVGIFGTITGLGLGMTLIRFRNELVAGLPVPFTSKSSRGPSTSSPRSRPRLFRATSLESASQHSSFVR